MTNYDGCVFCTLIKNKKYDLDTLHGVSFVPLNPVVPGHRLFIPRSHVDNAAENPLITAETMRFAATYAGEQGTAFNLITSAGSTASQSIFHFHVHYIPRAYEDGLLLPWTGQAA